MAAYWFTSEHLYQKLSSEYRELLHKGFAELAKVTRTLPQQRANDAYKIFEAAGGKVHRLDEESRLEFVKASKPLRGWYLNRYPKENLDQVVVVLYLKYLKETINKLITSQYKNIPAIIIHFPQTAQLKLIL